MGFVKGALIGLLAGAVIASPYMFLLRYMNCNLTKMALQVCFTEAQFIYQILIGVTACAILGGILFKIANLWF